MPNMYNPYAILGLRQTASNQEIRLALKKMVSIYCGNDESRKNSDGEYLKEIFCKAARDLLDSSTRKNIDYLLEKNKSLPSTKVKKETENKNVDNQSKKNSARQTVFENSRPEEKNVVVNVNDNIIKESKIVSIDASNKTISPSTFERKVSQIVLRKINSCLLESVSSSKFRYSGNNFKVRDLYAVFQEDSYFTFAENYYVGRVRSTNGVYSPSALESFIDADTSCYDRLYSLIDCDTKRNILGNLSGYALKPDCDMPWENGTIFEANGGIRTVACVADKFIPLKSIDNYGYVALDCLKILNEEISNLIFYNPKFIQALFAGRKETDRVKMKKMQM